MDTDEELPTIQVSSKKMGNDALGRGNNKAPVPGNGAGINMPNREAVPNPNAGINIFGQSNLNPSNIPPEQHFRAMNGPFVNSPNNAAQGRPLLNTGVSSANQHMSVPMIQGKAISANMPGPSPFLSQNNPGPRDMSNVLKPESSPNIVINSEKPPVRSQPPFIPGPQNPNVVPNFNQHPINTNANEALKSSQVNLPNSQGNNFGGFGPQALPQKTNLNTSALMSGAPELGRQSVVNPAVQMKGPDPPNLASQVKQSSPFNQNFPPEQPKPAGVPNQKPLPGPGFPISQPDALNQKAPNVPFTQPNQPVRPNPQNFPNNSPDFYNKKPSAGLPEAYKNPEVNALNHVRNVSPSPEKKPFAQKNFIKKEGSNKLKESQVIQIIKDIPKDNPQMILKKFLPEEILKKLENISKILTKVLDYNLIIGRKEEFIQKLNQLAQRGSKDSNSTLDAVLLNLQCIKCKNTQDKSIELKCGHLVCIPCLGEKINSSRSMSVECPVCNKKPEQTELLKIMTELKYDEELLKRHSLRLEYEENQKLECGNCKATKKHYYDYCPHMCKECFADIIRNKKIAPCLICYEETNFDEITNEVFCCESCGNNNYFIGSYGKYVFNENYLFCINCCYNFYYSGYNEKFNISLKKYEKVELNEHIFRHCGNCLQEKYRGSFEKQENCEHFKCPDCISQQYCKECLQNN